MRKVAVVLSGCGGLDGSEIREAVLTLLAIERAGARADCFAPDMSQEDVVDHLSGQPMVETRNALREAARITRGRVRPLGQLHSSDYHALMLPGGLGAAKTLSSFFRDGTDCTVLPELARAIKDFSRAGKPIGATCMAPVLLARVLDRIEITIGNDLGTASAIKTMGSIHRPAASDQVVVDHKARIATAACHMLDATLSEIATATEGVVHALLHMMECPESCC
ncbi:isoprenoid biosynthesis glyoxalase ElbB [Telmatospirillum sp. J64-1]|uniref:isoprenoid biosynthesis glyoxalase ElbB n=1 Tax=Telmatospirillum sp. J64-1 TaxID=2502183 RepID=UPI00115D2ADD|nr:isoprenoid biosynthesis glyoxalase ElbB [Telmatospirillum sp. J64-1]